ncbi:MAG: hypothetical protein M1269_05605 [Chloroflexi bacterium]|nr:hypothetical protein [Chloroflexota bacterium]
MNIQVFLQTVLNQLRLAVKYSWPVLAIVAVLLVIYVIYRVKRYFMRNYRVGIALIPGDSPENKVFKSLMSAFRSRLADYPELAKRIKPVIIRREIPQASKEALDAAMSIAREYRLNFLLYGRTGDSYIARLLIGEGTGRGTLEGEAAVPGRMDDLLPLPPVSVGGAVDILLGIAAQELGRFRDSASLLDDALLFYYSGNQLPSVPQTLRFFRARALSALGRIEGDAGPVRKAIKELRESLGLEKLYSSRASDITKGSPEEEELDRQDFWAKVMTANFSEDEEIIENGHEVRYRQVIRRPDRIKAAIFNALGIAIFNLPGRSEPELVESARCFNAALEIYTLPQFPAERGIALLNLAKTLIAIPSEDLAAVLREAEGCYKQAISIFTPEVNDLLRQRALEGLRNIEQKWLELEKEKQAGEAGEPEK